MKPAKACFSRRVTFCPSCIQPLPVLACVRLQYQWRYTHSTAVCKHWIKPRPFIYIVLIAELDTVSIDRTPCTLILLGDLLPVSVLCPLPRQPTAIRNEVHLVCIQGIQVPHMYMRNRTQVQRAGVLPCTNLFFSRRIEIYCCRFSYFHDIHAVFSEKCVFVGGSLCRWSCQHVFAHYLHRPSFSVYRLVLHISVHVQLYRCSYHIRG